MQSARMFPGILENDAPTGPVSVYKTMQEQEETIEQPLVWEDVDIERVIKNEPVDGPQPVREEGDTVIVPLVKQVLRVQKEWVLTEEIHVRRRREDRPARESVALQQEHAEILHGPSLQNGGERRGILGGRVPSFKGKLGG